MDRVLTVFNCIIFILSECLLAEDLVKRNAARCLAIFAGAMVMP
jgi:hypothetical protein